MADGSVVIGVSLDTSAFTASADSLELQIRQLGSRVNTSMAQAFAADGISASMAAALVGVSQTVTTLAENITRTMQNAAENAVSAFTDAGWSSAGSQAASALAGGISSGGGNVNSAARAVSSQAASAFSGGSWAYIGQNIMSGVASGILAAGVEVVSAIRRVSEEASAAVKSYYQISSPSALMRDEVGVMISRGIAQGILDGSSFVGSAMNSVYQGTAALSGANQPVGTSRSRAVTQNIYLKDDTASPYRTARRIKRESEAIFRL